MSQTTKSAYYQALKSLGHEFEQHYRKYNVDELRSLYLDRSGGVDLDLAPERGTPEHVVTAGHDEPYEGDFFQAFVEQESLPEVAEPSFAKKQPSLQGSAPQESGLLDTSIAGANALRDLQVIEVDAQGRRWLQREVRKPATAQPRGRRLLKYSDPGVRKESVQDGMYTEEVELPGEARRSSEVRVTLPSFQVGIYEHDRFPFRVVCYAGNEGFDFFEVNNFFGGAELVPPMIKRKYVENVLCYDIRLTIQAIQAEHRQLQLMGRI